MRFRARPGEIPQGFLGEGGERMVWRVALAVALALVLFWAVLTPGCVMERGRGVPGPEAPLISPPDLPSPPVTTVAVPGGASAARSSFGFLWAAFRSPW
ncbi:MAG TPA: hypothetical protein VMT31_04350 [Methanomicrobiales archaeon]|jgi:hypothetical protein|nr:hypothetical protein [Methanomicrobiales archaeon]